jgi:hypothetical protein
VEIKYAIIGFRLEGKKNPPTYFAINKDSGKEIMCDILSLGQLLTGQACELANGF